MAIYTVDARSKFAGVILETAFIPAFEGFQIIHVVLSDGRSVSASPGHHKPDGRAISDLNLGDVINGEIVVSVAPVPFRDSIPKGRFMAGQPKLLAGALKRDGSLNLLSDVR